MASKHAHALQPAGCDTTPPPLPPPHQETQVQGCGTAAGSSLCSSLLIPLGSQRLSMLSAPVATLFLSSPPMATLGSYWLARPPIPAGPLLSLALSFSHTPKSGVRREGGGEGESDFICTIGIPPALLPQPGHVTRGRRAGSFPGGLGGGEGGIGAAPLPSPANLVG